MTVDDLIKIIGPDATLSDVVNILDGIKKLRRACDARRLDARIVVTFRGPDGYAAGMVEARSTENLRSKQ